MFFVRIPLNCGGKLFTSRQENIKFWTDQDNLNLESSVVKAKPNLDAHHLIVCSFALTSTIGSQWSLLSIPLQNYYFLSKISSTSNVLFHIPSHASPLSSPYAEAMFLTDKDFWLYYTGLYFSICACGRDSARVNECNILALFFQFVWNNV